MLFAVIRADLVPRLAAESADGGENRLEKICGLMTDSRLSIHDLSRCQATRKGEIARLNMPFELGIDYGFRRSGHGQMHEKRFLVLDEQPYRLKQVISDIGGWDTVAHGDDAERAMKEVRNWLCQVAGMPLPGGDVLYGQSLIYDEWKYGKPDHARSAVDAYSPFETIKSMSRWHQLGGPKDPENR